MLEDDGIDISEGIDLNKTNTSKEYHICHYWYLKHIGFKYEPYLCNEPALVWSLQSLQKAMNSDNITIVYVKGNA